MKIAYTAATALALLLVGNGTYMLANPEAWYWAVPGVPDTGAFNPHFIRDIGFVYFLSGIGVASGLLWPSQRLGLWSAVASWQVAHAGFHVWEVVVGICTPDALARDFAGVTLPALVACGLVWWAIRWRPV